MARTGAWRPGYKVESRGLLPLLEDPNKDKLTIARRRERRSATAVSKRKRPDRKRELEMIDEFMATHAGAGR